MVPLVLQLHHARSVVDVGCGEGVWLAAFRRHGVGEILGIDGDYIDRGRLQIPECCFQPADLSKPLTVAGVFDLAVSLEVAEHLPPESAAGFVESLTRLAPVVLFSAAIPFQGGTHHVNEQWPDVWAALFQVHEYALVDCIRKRIWRDEAVSASYAQNTLLFVRSDVLESSPGLRAELALANPDQLLLVHPTLYLYHHSQHQETSRREAELRAHPASGLRQASRIFWDCLKNSFRARAHSVCRRWRPDAGVEPSGPEV
jgi:SAM-dependent methyltransferase